MTNALHAEDVPIAQTRINALPNGIYELSAIFGDEWANIHNPHDYGRKFFQTVTQGHLKFIRYHDRRLDNHRTYMICR